MSASARKGWALVLAIGGCLLCLGAPCRATIRYEVSLAGHEEHLFQVAMTIPAVSGDVMVQMPAWNALYQIRDFSAHVGRVEAFSGTDPAAIDKVDKQTWRVSGKGTVVVKYTSYWDEPGPFATQLNNEHAFINPAMILMYVPDRRAEDVELRLTDIPERWRVASNGEAFEAQTTGDRSFVTHVATYDELADEPIEAGGFKQFRVPGLAPEIWVVVHGDDWKQKAIEDELRRICQYELKLMDGAPFRRYTFILHVGKAADGAGGGMEHANSTAIAAFSGKYLSGVAAHEFFHLWNVKRIRPASLEPVDYTKEQYTRALWFAEGVTSTYGSYTLLRSGLWSKQQFYQDLGAQISELEARPANRWQSAEQSSLDAWLEKYALYNEPERSVSYYTKGQVLGVLLDIVIRDRTGGRKSLDDVLRLLNINFGRPRKPYQDSDDVRIAAEEIAGGSLKDFFEKYVSGTEPLPYQQVLLLAGLELRPTKYTRARLGFSVDRDAEGLLIVKQVDTASEEALQNGDVIVKWNGGQAPRRMERWLAEQKPGDVLRLRVRRGEKEWAIEVRLGEITDSRYDVTESAQAGEQARNIRDGLLRGTRGNGAGTED